MQRVATLLLTLTLLATTAAWGGGTATARMDEMGMTTGAVYALTNSAARNEVIAYARAADGALSPLGRFDTGGLGSAAGQSSPVDLGGGTDLLFAANAGSDEISVFQVQADGNLELVETAPSGGERPISLTVKDNVLYVLNSAGDLTGAGFCLGGAP